MKSDNKQEEAVPENVKNILLVMSDSGYFVPPSKNPDHEMLWVETWKRLDRFLPDLRSNLDLDGPQEIEREKEKPEVVVPVAEPEAQAKEVATS